MLFIDKKTFNAWGSGLGAAGKLTKKTVDS